MKTKSFWITTVVVFLVCAVYEFLIHAVILTNQFYKSLPEVLIQIGETPRRFGWLHQGSIPMSELIFSFFFVYIYSRGVEGKGWIGEGIRYGILIWGIAGLPMYVSMYGWARLPGQLLMWWIVATLIQCLLLGVICAGLYKKPAS
jgi:hypothetical protein